TRRTQFDLNKAEARAHIVEGLRIALDYIDEIIKVIRGSENDAKAKKSLMEKFSLSEIQAQAVLDMRLKRLTGLERDKLDAEYEKLIKEISKYKEILSNERLLYNIIKEEILEIKEKYGDRRRTRIVPSSGEIDIEDMIAEEDTIITLTHYGYIKRMPENTYRTQKRGGRGVIGLTTRDEDFVEDLFITSTHDIILFFTNKGNVFSLRGYEIPEAGRQAKGMAIINLLNLDGDEKISAVIPISSYDLKSNLFIITTEGITNRTKLDEFKNLRKNGIIAITLRDNDELIAVKKTDGNNEVILVTEKGIAIRFEEEDVRTMGRNAMGVKAIDLNQGDSVVAMDLIEDDKYLLAITENGFGKKTRLKEYRT